MKQHKHLECGRPVFVQMGAGKHQRALQDEQEGVQKANQVAAGGFHGVVPKGVDDAPRKDVAVIFASHPRRLLQEAHFLAKEQPPPLVFHQQNHDQHEDDGALRAKNGGVLGEAIVPHGRLHQMQKHKKGVAHQRNDINAVQAGCVFQVAVLRLINCPPHKNLVEKISAPCCGTGNGGWFRQFPVVPRSASIGQEIYLGKPRPYHPNQGGKEEAKQDTTPQGGRCTVISRWFGLNGTHGKLADEKRKKLSAFCLCFVGY